MLDRPIHKPYMSKGRGRSTEVVGEKLAQELSVQQTALEFRIPRQGAWACMGRGQTGWNDGRVMHVAQGPIGRRRQQPSAPSATDAPRSWCTAAWCTSELSCRCPAHDRAERKASARASMGGAGMCRRRADESHASNGCALCASTSPAVPTPMPPPEPPRAPDRQVTSCKHIAVDADSKSTRSAATVCTTQNATE